MQSKQLTNRDQKKIYSMPQGANRELARIQAINDEYEKSLAMRHFAFSYISDISKRRAYIQNIPRESIKSQAMRDFARSNIPDISERRAYIQNIPNQIIRYHAQQDVKKVIGPYEGSSPTPPFKEIFAPKKKQTSYDRLLPLPSSDASADKKNQQKEQDLCGKNLFYKTKKIIGLGNTAGKIYQAKSKNEKVANIPASYVVKEFEWPIKQWMLLEQKASKIGITPETVLIPCKEENKVYFIQKKCDGTLHNLIKNNPSIVEDKKINQQLRKLLLHPIQLLNIVHNDIHDDNILYKVNSRGNIQFYLIDFEKYLKVNSIGTQTQKILIDPLKNKQTNIFQYIHNFPL